MSMAFAAYANSVDLGNFCYAEAWSLVKKWSETAGNVNITSVLISDNKDTDTDNQSEPEGNQTEKLNPEHTIVAIHSGRVFLFQSTLIGSQVTKKLNSM